MRHTKWFLASSLLCCAGVVADQAAPSTEIFRNGDKLPKDKYPAGFNAYGGIQVENDSSYPDMFITASFLYYYATQGGMELGYSMGYKPATFTSYYTSNSTVLEQDFAFKPGFKVGIGFGYNESFFSADYTWIRSTTHTNANAPSLGTGFPAGAVGVWNTEDWFQQGVAYVSDLSSQWKLGLDIVDLLINRAFYQGRDAIIEPFFGLRGAWIRQGINVTATLPAGEPDLITSTNLSTTSTNSSNSWAIGPRAGIDASYLLGMGFRLEGKAAASLLVTQYTHVRHEENVILSESYLIPSTLSTEIKKYNCVRPEADLSIGLGWGKYLSQGKYHFDLSADYDFIAFFEQNMIRKLVDNTNMRVGAAASNLYFQGLNITARFDF